MNQIISYLVVKIKMRTNTVKSTTQNDLGSGATQVTETLRGRILIDTHFKTPFGDVERICANCSLRVQELNRSSDCDSYGREPHKYFHITIGASLPLILEGKNVGNYCPVFNYSRPC